MAAQVKLERNTLAGGEVSKRLWGQDDLARQRVACKKLENLVVLVEGGATRMPGTRFADPLKAENENGKLVDFRFSKNDAYHLLMNGGAMRVYREGGLVLDGLDPFELAIPWAAADLPKLRWAQDLDTMFLACDGERPRELARLDHDNWTLAEHMNVGGPVKAQNLDDNLTITASAVEGSVALGASADVFAAGHVGGVWRLDEPDLVSVALWSANEAMTVAETLQTGGDGFIGLMTGGGGLAAAFDGDTTKLASACASQASIGDGPGTHCGRDYGATPRRVEKVRIFGSQDQGYWSGNFTFTARIYGKNGSAPASQGDGTLLGQDTFADPADGSAGFDISSTDTQTAWKYVWVRLSKNSSSNHTAYLAQIQVYSPAAAATEAQRRYNGRVYRATTNGDTGSNPPEHEEGSALSGGVSGVTWQFLHNGYGFVRIAAVTDARNATATVLSRLPDSVVESATYRFWPAAWDDVEGWPTSVRISDGRLWWFRGNEYWGSRPRDFWDHEFDNTDESAISGRILSPSGELVDIEWALNAGVLVLGTPDLEWLLRSSSSTAALTAKNIVPVTDTAEGSAAHIPTQAEGGALFIGGSKRRLHFAKFDRGITDKISVSEVSLTARHILRGRAKNITFQRDPNKVAFIHCEDGALVGFTFMPREKVEAWHRHPKANGLVLDSCTVPAEGGERHETAFIIEREIDGDTRRYVEFLAPFFEPLDEDEPTAEGAWFLDCALKYEGAPVTNVAGLDHLEGESVGVFSGGRDIGNRTVTGGTLDAVIPASGDVLVGLRIPYKMHSLSFDPPTAAGSSKSKKKQANHILLEVEHSAGGKVTVNSDEQVADEDLELAEPPASGPMPLYSGRYQTSFEAATAIVCEIEVFGDDAYPFTLTGYGPDLDLTET